MTSVVPNEHSGDVVTPGMSRRSVVRAAGAGALGLDQRGIGLSDVPADGYDTGTLADDLVTLMDALGHQRFAPVGHDTGMPISYALAADHRDQVDRLAVAEAAMPGVAHSPPVRPWMPENAPGGSFECSESRRPSARCHSMLRPPGDTGSSPPR